jgi:hypothetical protein
MKMSTAETLSKQLKRLAETEAVLSKEVTEAFRRTNTLVRFSLRSTNHVNVVLAMSYYTPGDDAAWTSCNLLQLDLITGCVALFTISPEAARAFPLTLDTERRIVIVKGLVPSTDNSKLKMSKAHEFNQAWAKLSAVTTETDLLSGLVNPSLKAPISEVDSDNQVENDYSVDDEDNNV